MTKLIEPLEFLKTIHQKGVRYLLIGRQAVIAYGGPVQSFDYDIYIDSSQENLDLLLGIAQDFDLLPGVREKELQKHFKFRLENDFALDVFRAKKLGLKGQSLTFDEMYERRKILEGESGLKLNLPSIDDLIFLKKLRSSPKDLNDIEYLQAIKKG
ncbi:MAG: hypothetical protein ABIJ26_02325 [Candidatus Margulisiibacteriota bacterium]